MGAQPHRYVIVGAGIGGLATALAMSRAGLPVTLFERVTHPADVGAGIALHPNGLAVLYGLGLREPLQHGTYRTRHGTLAIGHRLRTVALPDYGSGLDHALALPRARLYRILYDAIARRTGIDTRFGHEVLGTDPDGRVEARAPDGTTYEIEADLVIGADGVGSVVRASGDFGAQRVRTPSRTARALVPGAPFGATQIEQWSTPGIAIGSPMGDGTSYLALSVSHGPVEAALRQGDLPALCRHAAPMLPGVAEALHGLNGFGDLLITPVDTVHCTTWHDRRLVLLGDAAHAMTPHLGQGANSALLDAYVLTEELARDQSWRAAVARYASRRGPTVHRIQRMAYLCGAVGERWTRPGVRHLRDAVVAAALTVATRIGSPETTLRQEHPATVHAALTARRPNG